MTIQEHETEFAGLPIRAFDPEVGLDNPQRFAFKVGLNYDDFDAGASLTELLQGLLDDPQADEVMALVIGCWNFESGDNTELVAALAAGAAQLPSLRALFVGDIVGEEQEVSWIGQSDLGPLVQAFPQLEVLRVRGATGLDFSALDHASLHTLIIESGGLPSSIVRQVCTASLPKLRHLELWLGSDNYGWDGTVADLQPILAGKFPHLDYLGLRDSEIADEVAAVVATSPVAKMVQTLDLSLGNMTDDGLRALLSLPKDGRLKNLDLHFHFCTPALVAEAKRSLPFEVDLSDPQEAHQHGDDVWRFIAVSE